MDVIAVSRCGALDAGPGAAEGRVVLRHGAGARGARVSLPARRREVVPNGLEGDRLAFR